MHAALFYIGSVTAIVAALAVVLARSPLRGALALISALCSLALLFVLLDAPFVAAMQVLVYAGAIMVLFVFVIMMLNLGPEGSARPAYLSIAKVLGVAAVGYLAWRVSAAIPAGSGKPVDGTVRAIGRLLLSDYLFGFEAVSVLLLVAVVGAVVFGLKRLA